MTITLHNWKTDDKLVLMALCNAVDRTFLSDRLPNPYTETDADWWLGMVAQKRFGRSAGLLSGSWRWSA